MRGPATQASEMDLRGHRVYTPPGRSTLGRHGRWLLVASLTLLLSGGLAATAWATPHSSVHLTTATTAPAPPAPASDAPRSAVAAPLPTVDTCTPESASRSALCPPHRPARAPATTTTPCTGRGLHPAADDRAAEHRWRSSPAPAAAAAVPDCGHHRHRRLHHQRHQQRVRRDRQRRAVPDPGSDRPHRAVHSDTRTTCPASATSGTTPGRW